MVHFAHPLEEPFFQMEYEDLNHGFLVKEPCFDLLKASERLPEIKRANGKVQPAILHTFSALNDQIEITIGLRAYKLSKIPRRMMYSAGHTEDCFGTLIFYKAAFKDPKKSTINQQKVSDLWISGKVYSRHCFSYETCLLQVTIGEELKFERLAGTVIQEDDSDLLINGEVSFSEFHRIYSTEHAGLVNNGMTCYMNSLLQTLFHIKEVPRQVFQLPFPEKQAEPNWRWVFAFQKLFLNLMTEKEQPAQTGGLTSAFGWNTLEVFTQQDVQEFCCKLLDGFEGKLKETNRHNFIQDLFRGQMENYIKCTEVDYESINNEFFYDLQLPVKGFGTIYESFNDYTAKEKLEGDNQYDAGEEFGKQNAEKGIRFKKFPQVLLLHLRRFEYDFQHDRNVKILSKHKIEEEIDVSNYLVEEEKEKDNRYKLFGILIHQGSTSNSGHYITYIRPEMNDWFVFNDESVSKVSFDYIQKNSEGGQMNKIYVHSMSMEAGIIPRENCSTAYMLVYIKTNRVEEILRPITNEVIPHYVYMGLKQEKLLQKKRRFVMEKIEILFTSTELLKGQPGFGCVLEYKGLYDDRAYRRFIEDKDKRVSLFVSKRTTLMDFVKLVAQKASLRAGEFGLWMYNAHKKFLTNVMDMKSLERKNELTIMQIIAGEICPIMFIEPLLPEIKLFRKITEEDVLEFEVPELEDKNSFTWQERSPATDKVSYTTLFKLAEQSFSLVIHKRYQDGILRLVGSEIIDKSINLQGLAQLLGINPQSNLYFEQYINDQFKQSNRVRPHADPVSLENQKQITELVEDDVFILISMEPAAGEDFFRNFQACWKKAFITVDEKSSGKKKVIETDVTKPTTSVSASDYKT